MANGMLETKVITGKVRLSYAHVWEPTSRDEGQEKKYSCSLIIPKTDTKTIDALNKATENAKKNGLVKLGGKIPPNLKLPLRDGDDERPDDDSYANSYFINVSARTKPGIVDIHRNPILSQDELYSGCYVIVSVNLYAYNASGNRGIAAGLNNIMKIADGEHLGGRVSAENDFADLDLSDFELDLLG